jgi:glycerate kinase
VTFEVACDVTNPLIGEKGASRIFGPQKGATEEMIVIFR